MINKIIDGISRAIWAEFGEKYEIYTQEVKQGLKKPCFSVLCINPVFKQYLGKRYFSMNQFCVYYFPENDIDNFKECNEVSERIFDCLELITVDKDIIRASNINSNINDGVLIFTVNYNLFVYKNKNSLSNMENIKQDTNVKG